MAAAGKSSRMGSLDKIFAPVLGQPLLSYSLAQLESFPPVTKVALVLDQDSVRQGEELVRRGAIARSSKSVPEAPVARTRCVWDSKPLPPATWWWSTTAPAPAWTTACCPAAWKPQGSGEPLLPGCRSRTPSRLPRRRSWLWIRRARETLWAAQTPQVFRYSLIWEAHQRCRGDFTDDASMLEQPGPPGQDVPGLLPKPEGNYAGGPGRGRSLSGGKLRPRRFLIESLRT